MLQVIDTAYGITGAICGLMGTLGYLMYGNGVKDVVTFNLPPVRPLAVQWRRGQRTAASCVSPVKLAASEPWAECRGCWRCCAPR